MKLLSFSLFVSHFLSLSLSLFFSRLREERRDIPPRRDRYGIIESSQFIYLHRYMYFVYAVCVCVCVCVYVCIACYYLYITHLQ